MKLEIRHYVFIWFIISFLVSLGITIALKVRGDALQIISFLIIGSVVAIVGIVFLERRENIRKD